MLRKYKNCIDFNIFRLHNNLTFKKVNNCDLKYKFAPKRKGDAAFLVADNKLALSKLKWAPKRDLNDMCRDAWLWQMNKNF